MRRVSGILAQRTGAPPSQRFSLPKVTRRRVLFAIAGVVFGLVLPVGVYFYRLFVVFRGLEPPMAFLLYELRAHFFLYLYVTLASSTVFGAIGFYIGAAKGWLSQQRSVLQETHDFYKAKIEEEVLRTRKLEAVSLLAGGIAHDFNNILTAILGNLSLARIAVDHKGEIDEALKAAEKATLSAKDLTQQLLTFSKGGAPIRRTTSTAQFIRDVVQFTSRGSSVRCDASVPADLWPVDIDEGQMTQVLNNLIINAQQAMHTGGTIEISAENIELSPEDGLPVPPGRYVKIAVLDRGVGIPEENMTTIFDPYFTTKSNGNGLGLTIAHSIITQHEGYIRVESKVAVGTTFNVYLPASSKAVAKKRRPLEKAVGGGKILVMDDDEMIRTMLRDLLDRVGYDAQFAENGSQAIELFREAKAAGRPFDCILMDLTVPGGLGGRETITRLKEIDPQVKAIVSSGYSNDPIMSSYRLYGFKGVVAKPYRVQDLTKTIREVIREKAH